MTAQRRSTPLALTLTLLALGAPPARAQSLVKVAPEAYRFRLGALELFALRDAAFRVENDGSVFGLNASPAQVGSVLKRAGAPTKSVRLDVDALLVKMPGHVALFDTGVGGALVGSLRKAGFAPSDVTDVFITHAHMDHIGGLVDASGGTAFPNAKVRMSSREWASMQKAKESQAVVEAIRSQVRTFEPGRAVLPGVTPLALYGHTPGHTVYEIASRGRRLMDVGDTAHSSVVSLARPDWTIEFDTDRSAGVRQRGRQLAALARGREAVFAPHFPFPGVGRIAAKGRGFAFRPGKP